MKATVSWMCMIVAAALVGAVSADEFEMSRYTIDGGGVMFSTGGDFELSGTIGQPDAGTLEGDGMTLTGGFWFPLAPADCDTDGGITLFDYSAFAGCVIQSGPDGELPEGCSCFDLDHDNDVDLVDAAHFQRAFTGG